MALSAEDAAAAVYRISNALIYDFLHKTTVERGLDPRHYALFSTGGTAGMHLPAAGQELGVASVVVPHSASVHGAFGLVTSDVVVEELATRPVVYPADPFVIEGIFGELSRTAEQRLERVERWKGTAQVDWSIDMRFRRQVHLVTVPLTAFSFGSRPTLTASLLDDAVERFERLYEGRYGPGSAYREAGVELVTFRVRVAADTGHRFQRADKSPGDRPKHVEVRRAWIPDDARFGDMRCYDFQSLSPGSIVEGPAIIWTPITTIVLTARQRGAVDGWRNIEITWSR
jgi:N-methylhydantoinase A